MTDRFQEATFRCECGFDAPVTKVTDREFDVPCPVCHRLYILSWHHDQPPPRFVEEPRLPFQAGG